MTASSAMHPFWVTVHDVSGDFSPFPQIGVGVTARSVEDALALVQAAFGIRLDILVAKRIMDMAELEQDHVVPNMDPHWMMRGIWWPQGYR